MHRAAKHATLESWITLQKDTIPPQEVVKSSLQQLQPNSICLAATVSNESPVFVDEEMRLCEK